MGPRLPNAQAGFFLFSGHSSQTESWCPIGGLVIQGPGLFSDCVLPASHFRTGRTPGVPRLAASVMGWPPPCECLLTTAPDPAAPARPPGGWS